MLVATLGLLSVGVLGLLVWTAMEPLAFEGGDGKGFQTHILNYLRFGAPFAVNILNPLQGAFSPQLPLNTWLNPGYFVFRLLDWDTALIATLLVSWLSLAIPTYILARAVGLTALPATVAAQVTIFVLPPFLFLFGFNTQYMLVPPTTVTVGVQTLLLSVLLRMSSVRFSNVAKNGLLIAAILYFALITDPLYFVAALLAMTPFAGVFVLAGGSMRLALLRATALLIAAALLYVAGAVDYLMMLIQYTARDYFKAEIGRSQLPSEASMLFAHPLDFGRTMVFVCSGWLLGLWLDRGPRRTLAIACVLHWLFVLAQGAVYVLAYVEWPSVAPLYLEQAAYHVYLLGALSGWWAVVERGGARLHFQTIGRTLREAGLTAMLSPVTLAVAWYLLEAVPINRETYYEPWPDQHKLIEAIRPKIGMLAETGEQFSGSAAILEVRDSYHKILTMVLLWRKAIPTANEYSQLMTPPMYYFGRRILPTGPEALNSLQLTGVPVGLGGLLGIRFVLREHNPPLPGLKRLGIVEVFDVNHKPFRWFLDEVPGPNLADYSPTKLRRAATARGALSAMAALGFDFQHSVVIDPRERIPALTSARSSSMSADQGRIRLSAVSDGDSLLVLPVQYSRCPSLADANARLIRADFLLTGVLFNGRIDSEISYDFGFLHSACRKADRQDLIDLGVAPEREYFSPAEFRHPLAAKDWTDLRGRIDEISRLWNAAVDQDRRHAVRFGGPITRWVRRWLD